MGRIEDDHKGLFTSTKPAYLSADYFADTLINFLRDKGAGVTDMEKVGFCLKFNTYHIQPKSLKQFRNLYENAGNNREAYKQNLMKWFNETMDRNNGWYKRKMRFILFWLGLIIAIAFNVDTIRIAKILANDKEARSQLVSMGVELAKDSARYKDFIYGNGDSVHSKGVLDSGFSRVTKDINAASLVLGLGWNKKPIKKTNVIYDTVALTKIDPALYNTLKNASLDYAKARKYMYDLSKAKNDRINSLKIKTDSLNHFLNDTIFYEHQIGIADSTARKI